MVDDLNDSNKMTADFATFSGEKIIFYIGVERQSSIVNGEKVYALNARRMKFAGDDCDDPKQMKIDQESKEAILELLKDYVANPERYEDKRIKL